MSRELAERYLYLRAIPGGPVLDERALLPLAERAEEVVFHRGSALCTEGELPSEVLFTMEGRVALMRDDETLHVLEPPAAIGIFGVLADDEVPYSAHALDEVVALSIDAETFVETLEDNFNSGLEIARAIALSLLPLQNTLEVPAAPMPVQTLRERERELDLVERMLLVRRFEPFGRSALSGLTEIAQQFRERWLEPGQPLVRRGEYADRLYLLVEGSLRDEHGHEVHAPASPPFNLETIAGAARVASWEATGRVRLLELGWETLVDVMEDHGELLRTVISRLAVAAMQHMKPTVVRDPSRLFKAGARLRDAPAVRLGSR